MQDSKNQDIQISGFINEGNPNTQDAAVITDKESEHKPSVIASDQQSVRVVQQAMGDNQSLSAVADDIHVTVKDGAITLTGQVANEQQMNLATNTAAAFEGVDRLKAKVINNMTIED